MCDPNNKIVRWTAAVLLILSAGFATAAAGPPAADPAQPKPPATQPAEPPQPIVVPGVADAVLKDFKALRVPVKREAETQGYIDWSNRRVIALGRSIQEGKTGSDILMAKRAAGVIALRNALAVAVGVRIGLNGRVDGLKDGRIALQGLLRGFTITKTTSMKKDGTIYWTAEVHVPMFGFKSIGGRMYDAQLAAHRALVAGWRRAAWVAPAKPDDTAGDLLVIDARGSGFRPSMYPVFVDADGRILMDMVTVGRNVAVNHGLCSYATTEMKFERLELSPPAGAPGPAGKAGATTAPTTHPATRPATRPTTGPGKPPTVYRRRRPRRYAVRATRSKGKDKAVLVVGNKEALQMLRDPAASHLAHNGRVLVIVDAAAAGIEGRLPLPGKDIFAAAR